MALRGSKGHLWLWLFFGLISACGDSPAVVVTQPAPGSPSAPTQTPHSVFLTRTPFQPLPPTLTPTATPTRRVTTPSFTPAFPVATPATEPMLWVPSWLPSEFRKSIDPPAFLGRAEDPEGASLSLGVGGDDPVTVWVYAVAVPFPSLEEEVTLKGLRRVWRGKSKGPLDGNPLLMDASTRAVLAAWWGEPEPGVAEVLPADRILSHAWKNQPGWTILPFDHLEPRWKVLPVDGVSPIQRDFPLQSYALSVPISITGDEHLAEILLGEAGPETDSPFLPRSNRDASKLTTLVMTGVTAMVRATAWTMEQRGIAYPARDIKRWLVDADLTHISNEVPFATNCPYPNPVQVDLRFCSDGRYIGLLEEIGTDIVELTGDHFHDWGLPAMNYTLELYRQRGWMTYGGGENIKDGRRAVKVKHNGNRLAFMGCNAKGGGFAGASETQPGAVPCDFPWMQAEIARLREDGFLPIVTFQHFEYYTFAAQPNQQSDFRRMADAGAVIVSGSQAHHPQGIEFRDGSFIHYGLGNLFFDQYDISPGTRQAFLDRHVFYNKRHISTELLSIIFEDYARARPMSPEEREALLRSTFTASNW